MQERIHFYFTNDLHSYFDHWPHVVSFLKSKRQDSDLRGESSWTVDIGDHMDRVHPISEATKGNANVVLLNEAGYDFVTLGNNEGITLSHDELFHLYDQAHFSVLCANLTCTVQEPPLWLQSYQIVETNQAVKIGLVGLTARFNPYYHLLGWNVQEVKRTMRRELAHLQQRVDIIVVLSHLGINEDEALARNFPEIDVIIGGHTHHLFRTGQMVEKTLLTAAGKHAAFAGHVMLTWDHEEQRLTNKEAYTMDITHLPKDDRTEDTLETLHQKSNAILNKEITSLETPLEAYWFQETSLMKTFTEKLQAWTAADCAMLNSGLLLDGLHAGSITYKDIHEICPHPINPCVVVLRGEELVEVVRMALTKQFMDIELKGFGFRGKVLGRMVFSNLTVKKSPYQVAGQGFVEDVLIDGKPVEADQEYKVATGDLFTFGRLLPPIARATEKKLFLPEFIRDILVESLKEFKK